MPAPRRAPDLGCDPCPADAACDPAEAALAAGLRYTPANGPGIRRRRKGKGWSYRGADGLVIHDPEELRRIRALAIPPAYTDVWINPDPRGHIQATGRDARGRKQYRYHPLWKQVRAATKFSQLIAFAEALPMLRERVSADLKRRGAPREKTAAAVVRLLDESLIRIGNTEYARANDSYGLTTLRDEHVAIEGATIHFVFRGKSGVEHHVDVRDRRLAPIVRHLQDLPGQPLFQYRDGEGRLHVIHSEDINAYLHDITGQAFTAKEFRTWAGAVLAARALRDLGPAATKTARHANIVHAIDLVAERLGNTRAVCRASYIHPIVLDGYERGALTAFARPIDETPGLDADERFVLAFLRAESAEAG
ncbi:MAG: DNA topoisomerase IB [Thermomicrobiales bacterium]|nr:DNA topoisomerase IB [Thermomicrobiales bacterium]